MLSSGLNERFWIGRLAFIFLTCSAYLSLAQGRINCGEPTTPCCAVPFSSTISNCVFPIDEDPSDNDFCTLDCTAYPNIGPISFQNVDFINARFWTGRNVDSPQDQRCEQMDIKNCDFSGASFIGSSFRGDVRVVFDNCNFNDTVWRDENSNFIDTFADRVGQTVPEALSAEVLSGISILRSTFVNAIFEDLAIRTAYEGDSNNGVERTTLAGVYFDTVDFSGSKSNSTGLRISHTAATFTDGPDTATLLSAVYFKDVDFIDVAWSAVDIFASSQTDIDSAADDSTYNGIFFEDCDWEGSEITDMNVYFENNNINIIPANKIVDITAIKFLRNNFKDLTWTSSEVRVGGASQLQPTSVVGTVLKGISFEDCTFDTTEWTDVNILVNPITNWGYAENSQCINFEQTAVALADSLTTFTRVLVQCTLGDSTLYEDTVNNANDELTLIQFKSMNFRNSVWEDVTFRGDFGTDTDLLSIATFKGVSFSDTVLSDSTWRNITCVYVAENLNSDEGALFGVELTGVDLTNTDAVIFRLLGEAVVSSTDTTIRSIFLSNVDLTDVNITGLETTQSGSLQTFNSGSSTGITLSGLTLTDSILEGEFLVEQGVLAVGTAIGIHLSGSTVPVLNNVNFIVDGFLTSSALDATAVLFSSNDFKGATLDNIQIRSNRKVQAETDSIGIYIASSDFSGSTFTNSIFFVSGFSSCGSADSNIAGIAIGDLRSSASTVFFDGAEFTNISMTADDLQLSASGASQRGRGITFYQVDFSRLVATDWHVLVTESAIDDSDFASAAGIGFDGPSSGTPNQLIFEEAYISESSFTVESSTILGTRATGIHILADRENNDLITVMKSMTLETVTFKVLGTTIDGSSDPSLGNRIIATAAIYWNNLDFSDSNLTDVTLVSDATVQDTSAPAAGIALHSVDLTSTNVTSFFITFNGLVTGSTEATETPTCGVYIDRNNWYNATFASVEFINNGEVFSEGVSLETDRAIAGGVCYIASRAVGITSTDLTFLNTGLANSTHPVNGTFTATYGVWLTSSVAAGLGEAKRGVIVAPASLNLWIEANLENTVISHSGNVVSYYAATGVGMEGFDVTSGTILNFTVSTSGHVETLSYNISTDLGPEEFSMGTFGITLVDVKFANADVTEFSATVMDGASLNAEFFSVQHIHFGESTSLDEKPVDFSGSTVNSLSIVSESGVTSVGPAVFGLIVESMTFADAEVTGLQLLNAASQNSDLSAGAILQFVMTDARLTTTTIDISPDSEIVGDSFTRFLVAGALSIDGNNCTMNSFNVNIEPNILDAEVGRVAVAGLILGPMSLSSSRWTDVDFTITMPSLSFYHAPVSADSMARSFGPAQDQTKNEEWSPFSVFSSFGGFSEVFSGNSISESSTARQLFNLPDPVIANLLRSLTPGEDLNFALMLSTDGDIDLSSSTWNNVQFTGTAGGLTAVTAPYLGMGFNETIQFEIFVTGFLLDGIDARLGEWNDVSFSATIANITSDYTDGMGLMAIQDSDFSSLTWDQGGISASILSLDRNTYLDETDNITYADVHNGFFSIYLHNVTFSNAVLTNLFFISDMSVQNYFPVFGIFIEDSKLNAVEMERVSFSSTTTANTTEIGRGFYSVLSTSIAMANIDLQFSTLTDIMFLATSPTDGGIKSDGAIAAFYLSVQGSNATWNDVDFVAEGALESIDSSVMAFFISMELPFSFLTDVTFTDSSEHVVPVNYDYQDLKAALAEDDIFDASIGVFGMDLTHSEMCRVQFNGADSSPSLVGSFVLDNAEVGNLQMLGGALGMIVVEQANPGGSSLPDTSFASAVIVDSNFDDVYLDGPNYLDQVTIRCSVIVNEATIVDVGDCMGMIVNEIRFLCIPPPQFAHLEIYDVILENVETLYRQRCFARYAGTGYMSGYMEFEDAPCTSNITETTEVDSWSCTMEPGAEYFIEFDVSSPCGVFEDIDLNVFADSTQSVPISAIPGFTPICEPLCTVTYRTTETYSVGSTVTSLILQLIFGTDETTVSTRVPVSDNSCIASERCLSELGYLGLIDPYLCPPPQCPYPDMAVFNTTSCFTPKANGDPLRFEPRVFTVSQGIQDGLSQGHVFQEIHKAAVQCIDEHS